MLILFNLGLVLISPAVNAEEYHLGFADKTRLTLIYEYTDVDSDLLEELAETTDDDIYEELSKIDEGNKIKLVISGIVDEEDHWLINVELYTGNELDKQGNDFETKVYKKPEKLADNILGTDAVISSFYFMPVDTKKYLDRFEEVALEDDSYLEMEYELYVNNTKITFDYTPFGYSDTVIQEYGDDGILVSFRILYYDKSVFEMELINSYEDYRVIIYSIVAIIILVIGISCLIFIVANRKKKSGSIDSKQRINEMLKDIN